MKKMLAFSLIALLLVIISFFINILSLDKFENSIENPNDENNDNEEEQDNQIKTPIEIDGFVLINQIDKDIIIDLRYATSNNFVGRIVYPNTIAVLRKETAIKLSKANDIVKKHGYRLKVWDAYRPVSVQKIFWELVHDSKYVSDPANGGSIHNRGAAVDVTLVDANNKELAMPTDFDDFSYEASRKNTNISNEVKANVEILTNAMIESGFIIFNSEWWHYQDSNYNNYEIADVDLDLFLNNSN